MREIVFFLEELSAHAMLEGFAVFVKGIQKLASE
jgi:hypothetical protein